MNVSPLTIALVALFYAVQAAATGYALVRGGMPERIVGAALLVAALTSTAAQLLTDLDFREVSLALVAIDTALLALLIAVALFADRFWPMWLAALQLVGVASHGVRGYDPMILPVAYWLIIAKIAYPMLLLLLLGTIRHRDRQRAGLPEHDWTSQRLRAKHERDNELHPSA